MDSPDPGKNKLEEKAFDLYDEASRDEEDSQKASNKADDLKDEINTLQSEPDYKKSKATFKNDLFKKTQKYNDEIVHSNSLAESARDTYYKAADAFEDAGDGRKAQVEVYVDKHPAPNDGDDLEKYDEKIGHLYRHAGEDYQKASESLSNSHKPSTLTNGSTVKKLDESSAEFFLKAADCYEEAGDINFEAGEGKEAYPCYVLAMQCYFAGGDSKKGEKVGKKSIQSIEMLIDALSNK